MHTRRELLAIAAGLAAGRVYAASGEFWNKKDPSEWSSQEIEMLTTKSPWAKEVAGTTPPEYGRGQQQPQGGGYPSGGGYPNGGGYPGGGYPSGRIGGMGIPGLGGGMGGGRPRNGGGGGMNSSFKGTIRWESAQVILDGMKSKVPDAFTNHYVISVSGIPISGRYGRSEDDDTSLDRLKGVTFLAPRGKRDLQPGIVQEQTSSYGSVLFGFSKEILTLTEDDKEVLFTTAFGRVNLKAKFVLKDMMYRGKLAL